MATPSLRHPGPPPFEISKSCGSPVAIPVGNHSSFVKSVAIPPLDPSSSVKSDGEKASWASIPVSESSAAVPLGSFLLHPSLDKIKVSFSNCVIFDEARLFWHRPWAACLISKFLRRAPPLAVLQSFLPQLWFASSSPSWSFLTSRARFLPL